MKKQNAAIKTNIGELIGLRDRTLEYLNELDLKAFEVERGKTVHE